MEWETFTSFLIGDRESFWINWLQPEGLAKQNLARNTDRDSVQNILRTNWLLRSTYSCVIYLLMSAAKQVHVI